VCRAGKRKTLYVVGSKRIWSWKAFLLISVMAALSAD
jgi:hypothetical protein